MKTENNEETKLKTCNRRKENFQVNGHKNVHGKLNMNQIKMKVDSMICSMGTYISQSLYYDPGEEIFAIAFKSFKKGIFKTFIVRNAEHFMIHDST